MANAPAYSNTTRAQRLGLLLPEETGGPIELPYVPEMTPGEQSAATMQQIRTGGAPKALPENTAPVRLPSSGFVQAKYNFILKKIQAGTASPAEIEWAKAVGNQ